MTPLIKEFKTFKDFPSPRHSPSKLVSALGFDRLSLSHNARIAPSLAPQGR